MHENRKKKFNSRLMIKLTIEHDHRIHCSCLVRIGIERQEICAIWLILWMCPSGELVWRLAVLMQPMMFVAALLIHLFELVMYYRLLSLVAMPNLWCIVPLVILVIAVQPLERFLVNQVFDLKRMNEINREHTNKIIKFEKCMTNAIKTEMRSE